MKNSDTKKCPACLRPLQNRLFDRCLYCEETLPDHLKLTDREKAQIKQQQREQLEHDLKRREQEAEEKEKQERQRRETDLDGDIFPFFF